MDRFFVDKKNIDLENKVCKIIGDDVKHISKVLRCKIGDDLKVLKWKLFFKNLLKLVLMK